MAIAIDQSPATASSSSAGTTIAKAYGSAVAAGTFLICLVQWASATDTETCAVSDTVNSGWTAIGSAQHDTTNHLSAQCFYVASSSAGTPTVTATISASNSLRVLHITSWTGVSGIEGTPSYNATNLVDTTCSAVTPAVSTDAILAMCAPADSVTAAGTGFTMVSNISGGLGFEYQLLAGTSAVTPHFTKNGTGKSINLSVVLAASASGSNAYLLPLLGVG